MTSDQQTQTADPGLDDERPADTMAALLEEEQDYRSPHRGDIVDGVVMGWDRDGVLIDIGAKSEGVVQRNEMQSLGPDAESRLQPGTKVLVYVIHPETMDGQIVLSLDRARGERGWHVLQERFESGETFEGHVTGYNRGGLLVNVEGVNAFVPLSQLTGVRPDRDDTGGGTLAEAVGKTLRLKVIEINRRRNRVILSERAALQEWRTQQKERLIQELREGDIRRGRISSVRSFGVFVDLGGADGLAHLSELSWDRNKQPSDLFKVGDEVDVYVTKIDAENKKIALSLRRAKPEKWDAIVDKYKEGQVVPGAITKLVNFGAFARIEGPVEGLIHVSELVDRRIGHPKEVVREGDLLPLKIVRIERDRHRLGLSLRRARDEGEGMGFVFTDGGEVLSVPEDIRTEFEAREGPIAVPEPEPEAESGGYAVAAAYSAAEEAAAAIEESAPAGAPVTEEPPAAIEQSPPTEATVAAEPPATIEEPPAAEAVVAEEPSATIEEPPAVEAQAEEAPAPVEEPVAEQVVEAPAEPAAEPPQAAVEEPPAEAATETSIEAEDAAEEPVSSDESVETPPQTEEEADPATA